MVTMVIPQDALQLFILSIVSNDSRNVQIYLNIFRTEFYNLDVPAVFVDILTRLFINF